MSLITDYWHNCAFNNKVDIIICLVSIPILTYIFYKEYINMGGDAN